MRGSLPKLGFKLRNIHLPIFKSKDLGKRIAAARLFPAIRLIAIIGHPFKELFQRLISLGEG